MWCKSYSLKVWMIFHPQPTGRKFYSGVLQTLMEEMSFNVIYTSLSLCMYSSQMKQVYPVCSGVYACV